MKSIGPQDLSCLSDFKLNGKSLVFKNDIIHYGLYSAEIHCIDRPSLGSCECLGHQRLFVAIDFHKSQIPCGQLTCSHRSLWRNENVSASE